MSSFSFFQFFSLRRVGNVTQELKKSVNGHHSRYWRDREGDGGLQGPTGRGSDSGSVPFCL